LEKHFISDYMRKTTTYILLLFALNFSIKAQTDSNFERFKGVVLSEHSAYFSSVSLIPNNIPQLDATTTYTALTVAGKKNLLNQITNKWPSTIIIVNTGVKKEMWKKADKGNSAILIDEWLVDITKPLDKNLQFNRYYFSLGYQNATSGGKTAHKYGYFRLGGFLILNRLDLSSSLSFLSIPVTTTKNDLSTNISLMARVHFPIPKYNLSPNIGFEFFVGGNDYTQHALNLGISYFVGFGSIDLGFRIAEIPSLMGGITVSPAIGK
jgi:hypothetical protein